jgi:hypothetical protein
MERPEVRNHRRKISPAGHRGNNLAEGLIVPIHSINLQFNEYGLQRPICET